MSKRTSLEVNAIFDIAIPANEGIWVYDITKDTWIFKINISSPIAQPMMSISDFSSMFSVFDEGEYVQIKNEVFPINQSGVTYYYSFDNYGKMQTGFIKTNEETNYFYFDLAIGELKENKTRSLLLIITRGNIKESTLESNYNSR